MTTTIIPGELVRIHPRVQRITAPNPGMMTGPGTNSYIIGDPAQGDLALIDPGPDIAEDLVGLDLPGGAIVDEDALGLAVTDRVLSDDR